MIEGRWSMVSERFDGLDECNIHGSLTATAEGLSGPGSVDTSLDITSTIEVGLPA